MSNFKEVKIFMEKFGQMVRTKPQFPDDKTMQLRLDLIKEELSELEEAMKTKNLKEVADALTDILYVTYGAGYAYGIDLDQCFKEVQRANMSKLGEDGKAIYNEQGKVMKGPNYTKPDLSKFVK
jgi:predicted HAD superfamily Cof-like phosphohydrolase